MSSYGELNRDMSGLMRAYERLLRLLLSGVPQRSILILLLSS